VASNNSLYLQYIRKKLCLANQRLQPLGHLSNRLVSIKSPAEFSFDFWILSPQKTTIGVYRQAASNYENDNERLPKRAAIRQAR